MAQLSELEFVSWSQGQVVVVAPSGVLDLGTAGQLRNQLAKLAADQPDGVVVDLSGLRIGAPAYSAVFAAAHRQLAEWPGVPLVLAYPEDGSMPVANNLDRYVPVRHSVAAAIDAVGDPPPRLVDRVLLANDPASPDIARRFARDSCVLWARPELAGDAADLLGELVTNAVNHTRSVIRVRVELRRELLSVAANDDDPAVPKPLADRSHGLAMVARVATAWGCSPTLLGGKVVWATIRFDGHRPRERRSSRGARP